MAHKDQREPAERSQTTGEQEAGLTVDFNLEESLEMVQLAEYEISSGAISIAPIPSIKSSDEAEEVILQILKQAGGDRRMNTEG